MSGVNLLCGFILKTKPLHSLRGELAYANQNNCLHQTDLGEGVGCNSSQREMKGNILQSPWERLSFCLRNVWEGWVSFSASGCHYVRTYYSEPLWPSQDQEETNWNGRAERRSEGTEWNFPQATHLPALLPSEITNPYSFKLLLIGFD